MCIALQLLETVAQTFVSWIRGRVFFLDSSTALSLPSSGLVGNGSGAEQTPKSRGKSVSSSDGEQAKKSLKWEQGKVTNQRTHRQGKMLQGAEHTG